MLRHLDQREAVGLKLAYLQCRDQCACHGVGGVNLWSPDRVEYQHDPLCVAEDCLHAF